MQLYQACLDELPCMLMIRWPQCW